MNKKKIALGALIIFVLIQLIQTDKSVQPLQKEETFEHIAAPSAEVAQMMRAACYDCHSNETVYPAYTYVAPVSWWINGHIKKARKAMNFSTWSDYPLDDQKHLLHECAEEIEEGHMPPKGYVRMHSNAYFDDAQKAVLLEWLKNASR